MYTKDFRSELTSLINRKCLENNSDTPDYILAKYLIDSLKAFDNAVKARTGYYGNNHENKESGE